MSISRCGEEEVEGNEELGCQRTSVHASDGYEENFLKALRERGKVERMVWAGRQQRTSRCDMISLHLSFLSDGAGNGIRQAD